VAAGGDKISNKRVFIDAGPGTPDGVLIGLIALPERCANLCFSGLKRNRLFMAASQSIYALYVNTQGALGG